MSGGFRNVLAGAVVVVIAYAVMSTWPALRELVAPLQRLASPRQMLPVSPSPTQTRPPATRPAVSPGGAFAASAAPVITPASLSRPSSLPESSAVSWQFAQRATVMHFEPGRNPIIPPCLNRAPLTILAGTRLWPVKTEGEWVMVRSPSRMLGWVLNGDIGPRRPRPLRFH
ncbi:hypothetical protein IIA79_02365 [bacterium]|nr:hypothetical protein [bacterium]